MCRKTSLFGLGLLMAGIFAFGSYASAQSTNGSDPNFSPAPFIADGTRNQNPAEGKLKGTTLRLKRVLVFVTDLKRSLDFYENVLGMERYAVDQVYSLDQSSMGNFMFNTEPGTRRRIATLDSSDETRAISLREVDTPFKVPQTPRVTTFLFEASDILGIRDRAEAFGSEIIGPRLGFIPEREDAPGLRYMEMGVLDPDGHVIAFFKYYEDTPEDDAEWEKASQRYKVEEEL